MVKDFIDGAPMAEVYAFYVLQHGYVPYDIFQQYIEGESEQFNYEMQGVKLLYEVAVKARQNMFSDIANIPDKVVAPFVSCSDVSEYLKAAVTAKAAEPVKDNEVK